MSALYLHGSTGSRPLREAGGEGLPVCVTVTRLDGLVLARSAFHHSVNYRSVVAHGVARRVPDGDELTAALDALVDNVVPGRAADSRRADAKELAATAVLRLDLEEVSAKVAPAARATIPRTWASPTGAASSPSAGPTAHPSPRTTWRRASPFPSYLTAR